MQVPVSKRLARQVMALTLRIAPRESQDWAAAMSTELEYVDGSLTTLSWAVGCFGAALKQLCFSIFSRASFGDAMEAPMSKSAKISALALIVGSALFLLAPRFRQGLSVTAATWHQSDSAWLNHMRALATKAEADHDADTLAFAAMQMNYDVNSRGQRDKFADEAVTRNSRLTWIYFPLLAADIMSSHRDADPNALRWMKCLQAWDPNNAAVYALEASYSRPSNIFGWNSQSNRAALANSPEWLHDMDRAFSSSTYDSYAATQAAFDRNVAGQHGLEDPRRVLLGFMQYPLSEVGNSNFYEKYSLLPAAADFEAKGDVGRAQQTYEKVAHLGELMQVGGYTDLERVVGIGLQQSADKNLDAIFEKNGNTTAANLVAFQMASEQQTADLIRASHFDLEASLGRVDAFVLEFSLIGIALSLALIVVSCAYLVGRRLFNFGKAASSTVLFARTAIAGTVLLFASVIVMYFGYSPYASAFHAYLGASSPRDAYQTMLRFEVLYELPSSFFYGFQRIYLWYTVIAAGGAVIAWILYRHIARTFRHSAPVQPVA